MNRVPRANDIIKFRSYEFRVVLTIEPAVSVCVISLSRTSCVVKRDLYENIFKSRHCWRHVVERKDCWLDRSACLLYLRRRNRVGVPRRRRSKSNSVFNPFLGRGNIRLNGHCTRVGYGSETTLRFHKYRRTFSRVLVVYKILLYACARIHTHVHMCVYNIGMRWTSSPPTGVKRTSWMHTLKHVLTCESYKSPIAIHVHYCK